MYNIGFPNLNLYFNISPIAFSIGEINIYWYGIIIATAIIVGLTIAKLIDGKYNIRYSDTEEFVLWTLPISIVFARIYYVTFSWDLYKNDLSSIFKIWEGGIAIYGAIIGAIITAIIYSKVKKIKLFDLLDYCVPMLALGQAIGRWGNFINREAFGSVTNSFFRMELLQKNGEYISVHPTFLYESLGLIVIFLLLILKRRKVSGEKVATYFLFYGILRSFVEWLRTDSLMLGNIKISMILSVLLSITGLIFLIVNFIKKNKEKTEVVDGGENDEPDKE